MPICVPLSGRRRRRKGAKMGFRTFAASGLFRFGERKSSFFSRSHFFRVQWQRCNNQKINREPRKSLNHACLKSQLCVGPLQSKEEGGIEELLCFERKQTSGGGIDCRPPHLSHDRGIGRFRASRRATKRPTSN